MHMLSFGTNIVTSLFFYFMSLDLALPAAALLGAAYIDAKIQLKSDVFVIAGFIKWTLYYRMSVFKHKVSFWFLFESVVRSNPDKIALAFPKPRSPEELQSLGVFDEQDQRKLFELETFTFKELYNQILRLSHILKTKYGVAKNDTVIIDFSNKSLYIIIWFALWNLGATPVFLNYNLVSIPLIHSVKVSDATHCFIDWDTDIAANMTAVEKELKVEAPNCQLHYMEEDKITIAISKANKYRTPDNERPDLKPWDPAMYIYTSGTSGLPKLAIMSWEKAVYGSVLFGHVMRMTNKELIYSAMPLYHSTAAVLGVLPAFGCSAGYAIGQKFSAKTFWTQVKLTHATYIQYVGEVCRYLINSPPHKYEKTHGAKVAFGNGLRKDIWLEFKERFNIPTIGEFYAATEAPMATTNYQTGDFAIGAVRNYGLIVRTILSLEQTIIAVDPDDDGEVWRDPTTGFCRVANPDEPGEFLFRIFTPRDTGKHFQGYKGNEHDTNKKILRDVFHHGDAYFRSGDLLKADKDGLYYFVDRLGDTFRWKSENVSTNEVEGMICKYDQVEECVVVGVKVPNHEGRAGLAVITTRNGMGIKNFNLDRFAKHLKENLPKFAIPLFVKFVNKLEYTGNHKVVKRVYQNDRFPAGSNGNETIYWFHRSKYTPLSSGDWSMISAGQVKL